MNSNLNFKTQSKIVNLMHQNKILNFNFDEYYTWTSGIKSPIYCDFRLVNSIVNLRDLIVNELINDIKTSFPECNTIAGVATSGISLGAYCAYAMNLPFIYVNKKLKEHGTKKQIEGSFNAQSKIVVIEDVLTTANSSITAYNTLTSETKNNPLGVCAIFSYNLNRGIDNLKKAAVNATCLLNFPTMMKCLAENNLINQEQLEKLTAFYQQLNGQ